MSSPISSQNSLLENLAQQIDQYRIGLDQPESGNPERLFETMVNLSKDICILNFHQLFKRLNLDEVSIGFLKEVVFQEPLVQKNVECLKLVIEKLFQIIEDKSSIISLGGKNKKGKVEEVYNLSGESSTKPFKDLPVIVYKHCSLKMNNSIVCIGGCKDQKAISNVWQMHLTNDALHWEEIASMKQKRFSMGAAVYKNSIIVAGGYDGKNCLKSVETFQQTDEWKLIDSLKQARCDHALVVNNGCLFAIGGSDGKQALSSVEILSGLDEEWKSFQSMNNPRQFFAAVTCQNKIFAIGGLSKNSKETAMKSVEMFDHSTQNWSEVESMNIERWGHSACVLQNKIFVVGGKNKYDEFVNKIECYDVHTNQWSTLLQETDNWMHHSIVALIEP